MHDVQVTLQDVNHPRYARMGRDWPVKPTILRERGVVRFAFVNARDDRIHYRLCLRRSPSPAPTLKSITTMVTSSGRLWPFLPPRQLVI